MQYLYYVAMWAFDGSVLVEVGEFKWETGTGSVKLGSEINCQYFGLLVPV